MAWWLSHGVRLIVSVPSREHADRHCAFPSGPDMWTLWRRMLSSELLRARVQAWTPRLHEVTTTAHHEWPRKLRIVTAQLWIKIRMATNVEVHMCLRLLNRAAVHVYCHYWPLTFSQRAPPTYSSGINKMTCVPARAWIIVFWNSTGSCVVYITLVLGQLSGLSKDACLYTGADRLELICQSEDGD